MPLAEALTYLDGVMDRFQPGRPERLLQSYDVTAALNLADTAFTYDNALVILAYLARNQVGDRTRAVILGDSLLYAMAFDPIGAGTDGRLRDSYHANRMVGYGGANVFVDNYGVDSGNMLWAGLALAQLYRRVGLRRHLAGAEALALLVARNQNDARGAGGYTGGWDGGGAAKTYKSSEHAADAYGLFNVLNAVTGLVRYAVLRDRARTFLLSVWNPAAGHFWTGTQPDGVTTNTSPIPADVQNWTYLSLADPAYAAAVTFSLNNHSATQTVGATTYTGQAFSGADRTGVWFEGTAHAALALQKRNGAGDAATAATYLASIEAAQTGLPNSNGTGVPAASKDGLDTGFNFGYYQSPHIGASAFYVLARQNANPFSPTF